MKIEEFIKLVNKLPVIDTEILLAGKSNPKFLKVQISRWQKSGKLVQLKRGIYLLAEEYRKVEPYEPYIASILRKPSYISLEKALEYHGLIPESVRVFTSLTTKRPAKFSSALGSFSYRSIKRALFWGYASVTVNKQTGFFASPEKALLDLIYLNGVDVSTEYLIELRLQGLEKISLDKLWAYAQRFKKPKILRAAKLIKKLVLDFKNKEMTL